MTLERESYAYKIKLWDGHAAERIAQIIQNLKTHSGSQR